MAEDRQSLSAVPGLRTNTKRAHAAERQVSGYVIQVAVTEKSRTESDNCLSQNGCQLFCIERSTWHACDHNIETGITEFPKLLTVLYSLGRPN
jgi:hypothetical protein